MRLSDYLETGVRSSAELGVSPEVFGANAGAARKRRAGSEASMVQAKPTVSVVSAPAQAFDAREALHQAVYEQVSSERIVGYLAEGRRRAEIELGAIVARILKGPEFAQVSVGEKEALSQEILDLILGLGPLETMLADESVTEIMVNGPQSIFIERGGVLEAVPEHFSSEEELRLVIDRIISPIGRRLDEQSPVVNARLPQGHRVNAVIPPLALNGTALTIRKFRPTAFSLDDLVSMGSMSEPVAQLLKWAVLSRCNVAVAGGTGSGKTTLLNALAGEIPHDERIVTIEDSAELHFEAHPHVVRLEARMANAEGKGGVSIRDLVTNSLRMRPDRIVVGECRDAEAVGMLQAMTTGHDGSLTTLHANSPAEVIGRLTTMVRYAMDLPIEAIEAQISAALDVVVQQARLRGGKRRVTQVVVRPGPGYDGPLVGNMFMPVVAWSRARECYVWNVSPDWVDSLPVMGIASYEEVEAWKACLLSG